MQLGQPERRPGDLGALAATTTAARSLLRHRRAGCRPSTTPSESGLWHFGAWVWRAPAGTVFTERAGQRQPHQPGRPPRPARRDAPGGRAGRVRRRARRLPRPLASTASSPSFTPGFAASRPVPGDPAGAPAATAPTPTFAASSCAPRTASPPALTLTGGSLLGDAGGPRRARARLRRRPTRRRHPQGLRRGQRRDRWSPTSATARCSPASRPRSVPAPRRPASRPPCRPPTPRSPPGPNTVTACVEDLALDGAANRACEQRQVWVDNACPASAVAGGIGAQRRLRRRGAERPRCARTGRRSSAGGVAGAGAGATVCALTRVRLAGAADRGRRHGDDRRPTASYAIELPPGAEPRGLRPLRRRRPGRRPPRAQRCARSRAPRSRSSPATGFATAIASTSRAPFRARPASTAWSRSRRGWQAPLAGLPHRPRRRRLPLHAPATSCAPPAARAATASGPWSRSRPAIPYERGHSRTARVKVKRRRCCRALGADVGELLGDPDARVALADDLAQARRRAGAAPRDPSSARGGSCRPAPGCRTG